MQKNSIVRLVFRMDKKNVSVIIPTYNGCHLLKTYLSHTLDILSTSSSISSYEIIVIDQASSGETVSYLKELSLPELTLIVNEVNLGFSKTINKGIQQAKMELSLLLNSDMELPSDFFDKTIPFFSDPSVFGVYTEIRDRAGEKIIESRKLPLFKHHELHYRETTDNQNNYSIYLCGGNALVDTHKLKELNGFNELFSPFYFEDFDLSLRAWRKGWKSLYTNNTFCRHTPSSTIKKENKNTYVETIFRRNKLLLNYLHNSTFKNLLLCGKIYGKFLLYSFSKNEKKQSFISSAKAFLALKKKADIQRVNEYNQLPPIDWSLFQ